MQKPTLQSTPTQHILFSESGGEAVHVSAGGAVDSTSQ